MSPISAQTREALLLLAIQQAPLVIAGIKALFRRANPDLPVPTDEEIIAAELHAFTSSLAKDEAWLAAHPEDVENPTGDQG